MNKLLKITRLSFISGLMFSSLHVNAQVNREDSLTIRSIYDEVLSNGEAYENLRVLTKSIGHRLSGSPQFSRAMVWGEELLERYGADSVFVQPVTVPSWTRGEVADAKAHMSDGSVIPLHITALGGSVGTPGNEAIRSKIVIVKHLSDLDTMDADFVKDRIVLFNRAMDPIQINTGSAYGGAWDQRGLGAIAASKVGAKGALIRSLTHSLDTLPHTGAMRYDDEVKDTLAAAISTVDARMLAKLYKEDPDLEVEFTMDCKELGDIVQENVIGEWTGSEFPKEIISIGGHLDSWDIGEGAHDDGAGVVHSIEVLRLLKAIGYAPKRTIRIVLFINEENGNRGGIKYAEIAADELERGERIYVAAMESDAGGFSPRGFNADACEENSLLLKVSRNYLSHMGCIILKWMGWSRHRST